MNWIGLNLDVIGSCRYVRDTYERRSVHARVSHGQVPGVGEGTRGAP